MDSQSTPRLSAPYLDGYVGRNVTVVGKVVQIRGESAVVDADGHITAHLNRVCVRYTSCAASRPHHISKANFNQSPINRKLIYPLEAPPRSLVKSIRTSLFESSVRWTLVPMSVRIHSSQSLAPILSRC